MDKSVILVTGANRGIGFEIVRQLSRLGHEVILTARDNDKGNQAVKKLAAEGLKVYFIRLDVLDEQEINEAVAAVRAMFGHLDILINNAGVMIKSDRSILDIRDEVVERQCIPMPWPR